MAAAYTPAGYRRQHARVSRSCCRRVASSPYDTPLLLFAWRSRSPGFRDTYVLSSRLRLRSSHRGFASITFLSRLLENRSRCADIPCPGSDLPGHVGHVPRPRFLSSGSRGQSLSFPVLREPPSRENSFTQASQLLGCCGHYLPHFSPL